MTRIHPAPSLAALAWLGVVVHGGAPTRTPYAAGVWAAVLAALTHLALSKTPPANATSMLCTPAILLSLHWSTLTALSRLAPQHQSGIAEEAKPFVALTLLAGIAMLLAPPDAPEEDEDEGDSPGALQRARPALAYLGVGAFAMHVAITLTTRPPSPAQK